MKNEYLKFHLWGWHIKRDISVQKLLRKNKIFYIMREGKTHETHKELDAKDDARYRRIRNAKTAAAAKQVGGEILNTERWNSNKRVIMRGWLFKKYRQNPELADFLISTKGYHLIEASPFDSWWGAGAGLESQEF